MYSMAMYSFVSNPVSCDNQEQCLQRQPLSKVSWLMAVCIFVSNPVNGASQEQRLQSQPPLKVVG